MGRNEELLAAEGIETVRDIWKVVAEGRPLPDNILCAINLEYVNSAALVTDGDEVAFFPPVTGGSV